MKFTLVTPLTLFLCFGARIFGNSEYAEIFGSNYVKALHFLKENRELLSRQLKNYEVDAEILLPVIFPELVRYSLLQDKMETTGLKIFYTNLGKDYANFSIGYFQMKPSFVENLEEHFRKQPHPICSAIAQYALPEKDSDVAIRRQRIYRLETLSWQIQYLACFSHALQKRFYTKIHMLSVTKKIQFFASAYNAGFDSDFAAVVLSGKQNFFPYGKIRFGKQYNYSDIAVDFYKNFWRREKY